MQVVQVISSFEKRNSAIKLLDDFQACFDLLASLLVIVITGNLTCRLPMTWFILFFLRSTVRFTFVITSGSGTWLVSNQATLCLTTVTRIGSNWDWLLLSQGSCFWSAGISLSVARTHWTWSRSPRKHDQWPGPPDTFWIWTRPADGRVQTVHGMSVTIHSLPTCGMYSSHEYNTRLAISYFSCNR